MKSNKLYLLLLASLILTGCDKSDSIVQVPNTDNLSIYFYKTYSDSVKFIGQFNVSPYSSLKLSELPSLNIVTYYKNLSFHPQSDSNTIKNTQVFFIIKDNVTNEITMNRLFLDGYYVYSIPDHDSLFVNYTVYAFLVKDLNSTAGDTINFEIVHDGVKNIIPIIPAKNTVELKTSLVINKNFIDSSYFHYLSYTFSSSENEKVGFIWNAISLNDQTEWMIDYFNSGEGYPYAFTRTLPDELKFYAFKLIY